MLNKKKERVKITNFVVSYNHHTLQRVKIQTDNKDNNKDIKPLVFIILSLNNAIFQEFFVTLQP